MKKLAVSILILLATFSGLIAEHTVSGHYTQTDDSIRIYYETQGEGTPVMMIAGSAGRARNVARGPTNEIMPK